MGILIALIIILLWAGHLIYSLQYVQVIFDSPFLYLHILIQAYLYTGLFITAHDAMHKTVSRTKWLNNFIGRSSTLLFAGLSYKRLLINHFKHHKYPGETNDPDFSIRSQNFFIWWGTFLFRYATVLQIITMAVAFNLLKFLFDELSIWMYWVIPAFLGTLQLFYFGTYIPHKKPHTENMKPHNARTLKKNHLWALLSCYFFGYHYEHHQSPGIPWWKLYKTK